jgi:hypothetical protein
MRLVQRGPGQAYPVRVATPTGEPAPADGLVGRRHELGALRIWLAGAQDGVGRLVLCVGEPGIGKTSIAQKSAGIALAQGAPLSHGDAASRRTASGDVAVLRRSAMRW